MLLTCVQDNLLSHCSLISAYILHLNNVKNSSETLMKVLTLKGNITQRKIARQLEIASKRAKKE